MSLAELPQECLELILSHLAHDQDATSLASLASLLLVNKHLCTTTLPLLYSNPFHLALGAAHARGRPSNESTAGLKLVNLLLKCAPQVLVTDLLRAAYYESNTLKDNARVTDLEDGCQVVSSLVKTTDVFQTYAQEREPARPLDINYLSYLRHFTSIEPDPSQGFIFRNSRLLNNSNSSTSTSSAMNILHNYLHGASGLAVHYYDQVLSLEVNPYQSPEIFLERYLSVDLRVQVTWALCSSILETLQSIVLPLKDIDRYLSNVHKFQHLTHVVFKLDEKLTYPDYIYGVMKEDHPNWARLLNDRRDRALSKMVLFVKDHTHLFPRQLKSATCPEDSNWHPQNCPASVHAALQACLSLS